MRRVCQNVTVCEWPAPSPPLTAAREPTLEASQEPYNRTRRRHPESDRRPASTGLLLRPSAVLGERLSLEEPTFRLTHVFPLPEMTEASVVPPDHERQNGW
jgi:hypothetical protein